MLDFDIYLLVFWLIQCGNINIFFALDDLSQIFYIQMWTAILPKWQPNTFHPYTMWQHQTLLHINIMVFFFFLVRYTLKRLELPFLKVIPWRILGLEDLNQREGSCSPLSNYQVTNLEEHLKKPRRMLYISTSNHQSKDMQVNYQILHCIREEASGRLL